MELNTKQNSSFKKLWIGLILVVSGVPVTISAATLNTQCAVTQTSPDSLSFFAPGSNSTIGLSSSAIGNNAPSYQNIAPTTVCLSLNAPSVALPCSLSSDTITIPDGSPYYSTIFDDSDNTYCSYEITLMGSPAQASGSLYTIPEPSPVPFFTPLGLLATVAGLLWVGRRRSKTLLSQNT